ncbi:hypothetical protein [Afifella aestuarii]|uniref:hypothetical protein n=1 Tax=Afifella aestuarii TaxID=1909496 RepID=UPI000FE346FF|nr:hypothetical protein [Afifella aestuarii]
MAGEDWVLRIEGVNFGAAVFNTGDLSTIRGASLAYEVAMEDAAERMEERVLQVAPNATCERIYVGGSQAAFRIKVCDAESMEAIAARLRRELREGQYFVAEKPEFRPEGKRKDQNRPPTQHLCFVVDVAPVENDDEAGAVDRAMTRSRFRQMRAPSLPRAEVRVGLSDGVKVRRSAFCPIDPMRPAAAEEESRIWTAPGQFPFGEALEPKVNAKGDVVAERIAVCRRVGDLRPYGRTARWQLYKRRFKERKLTDLADIRVAESFEDIVEDPPKDLPESAKGKMAVFYVDGAGFGALRRKLGLREFSQLMQELYIDTLLYEQLADFDAGSKREKDRYARFRFDYEASDGKTPPKPFLRFETLMFGGEDWCFVVPSWLASEVLERIFARTAEFSEKGGVELGLRAGVLICPSKTPIRRATGVAHDLCDGAKLFMGETGARSAIDIHVMESIDVPYGALKTQRRRIFGAVEPEVFGFDGGSWTKEARKFRHLSRLPRSQLYALIRRIGDEGDTNAKEEIRRACERSLDLREILCPNDAAEPDLDLLPAKAGGGDISFRLKRLADLWDYVVVQPEARS